MEHRSYNYSPTTEHTVLISQIISQKQVLSHWWIFWCWSDVQINTRLLSHFPSRSMNWNQTCWILNFWTILMMFALRCLLLSHFRYMNNTLNMTRTSQIGWSTMNWNFAEMQSTILNGRQRYPIIWDKLNDYLID